MPRLPPPSATLLARTALLHRALPRSSASYTLRSFASTDAAEKGAQNSRPGWSGRPIDDHAVKRDGTDSQSKESQEGMKRHEDAKAGQLDTGHGQGVSRRDEAGSAQKTKEEFPEAPDPGLGMNSERGRKGNQ
ncbi:uncharacterized protein AB675_6927 [Cyphellophora attinorum]|uniref:Uncharacterized protein n=1 Tax=Cyphellophora attinorum TaxID=1664694 RepID=A0A0N1P293_9EURO|nr:uncharacterized protein AB675_6927 [Phialophora attinorum]KPI43157.1 hypothetical protein AB675_6927 [Phialophora attinorum]